MLDPRDDGLPGRVMGMRCENASPAQCCGAFEHQRVTEPEAMGAIIERIDPEPQRGLKVKPSPPRHERPGKYA